MQNFSKHVEKLLSKKLHEHLQNSPLPPCAPFPWDRFKCSRQVPAFPITYLESPDHGDEHELMLQILYRSPKCDPVGFPVVGLDFFCGNSQLFSVLRNVLETKCGGLVVSRQHLNFELQLKLRMM